MTKSEQLKAVRKLIDQLDRVADSILDHRTNEFSVGDRLECIDSSIRYDKGILAVDEQYEVCYVEARSHLFMRLKILESPRPTRVGRYVTVTDVTRGRDGLCKVVDNSNYLDLALNICKNFIRDNQ